MPIYEVQTPDGRILEIQGPEGASDAQLINTAALYVRQQEFARQQPVEPEAPAQPQERTWGEALVTDPFASIASGVGTLMQLPGQVGQLAGMYRPEEAKTGLQGTGKELEEYGQAMKSAELKRREQARAQKVAQETSIGGEAMTAIGETISDPALISSFIFEQIPNLFGSMGGGLLTKAGVKLALRGATEQALEKAAVRGAVGTGAIMQGADIGSDTYEQLYTKLKADGYSNEDANRIALDKARVAAIEASTISLGTAFLPGGTTIERAIVGRGLPRTGGVVKGLVGEGLSEGVEEGGGKFVSNVQQAELYPEMDIYKGVGEAAGLGALMGGAFGGAGGISLRAPQQPGAEIPPGILPPTEAPPPEVPPAGEGPGIRELEEVNPPIGVPPVEPPLETPPPVETPPVETPPVEAPPVQPPVETPPPVEAPPVQPPVAEPPVESPPVQPPVVEPPIETPPAVEPTNIFHPLEIAMQNGEIDKIDEAARRAGVRFNFREGRIDVNESKLDWDVLKKLKTGEKVLNQIRDVVPLDMREIIDRITPYVKHIPIRVSNVAVPPYEGVHYLRGKGKDALHNIELFANSNKGNSFETITHELIHGATVRNYFEGRDYNLHSGRRGDRVFSKASKELDQLAEFLVDNHFKDISFLDYYKKRGQSSADYTSSIARELLSWGTTNRETQEQLKKIKLPSGKSAWTKFVETLRNLLQIPATETNALTRILELQDKLIGGTQAKPYVKPRAKRGTPQAVADAQEVMQNPNFRKWFGDSKIVDENGNPLVVYHGTNYVDEQGRPLDKFQENNGAIFVATDPDFATKFAMNDMLWNRESQMPPPEGAHVLPVYVRAENTFDFSNPKHIKTVASELEDSRDRARFVNGAKEGNWGVIEDFLEFIQQAGFDSFYVLEQGRKNLGLFSPNQLKSLFNQGTYSEESPIISESMAPRQKAVGGAAPEATWGLRPIESETSWTQMVNNKIYEFVDKYVDLKDIIKAINAGSKKLDETWNAYRRETLYHNRVAYMTNDFLKGELKPLAEDMVKRGISEEELNNYLLARHAEEYNDRINQRNPSAEMQHRGSGVETRIARAYMLGANPQQVEAIRAAMASEGRELNSNEEALLKDLAKMSDAKRKNLAEVAKRIDSIVEKTQNISVNGGLEKKSTIDFWRDMYPHYVPLKRSPEELDFVEKSYGAGKGFSTKSGFGRAATGSLKTVDNIMANLILQRDMAIVRTEKGRIGRALYAMALQNPNPKFWLPVNPEASVISKANDLYAQIAKDKESLQRKIDKVDADQAAGREIDEADLQEIAAMRDKLSRDMARHAELAAKAEQVKKSIIEELGKFEGEHGLDAKAIENLIREPQGAWYNPETGQVEYRTNAYLRSSPNVLAIPVDGETRYIFFNPGDSRAKRLVNSLKSADVEQLGQVTAMVGRFTRWIAQVNTQFNPFFGIVNWMRDVQGAQFNLTSTPLAGKQMAVNANIPGAMATIFRSLRSERADGKPTGPFAADWLEFQKLGGPTGIKDMLAREQNKLSVLGEELKKLQEGTAKKLGRRGVSAVFDLMSDFNDTMENSVRLAAFIEAKKKFAAQGFKPDVAADKAAELAKNLTVNFNRKGQKSQMVNSWFAFFNAAAQGTARLAETLKGPAGKKIAGSLVLLGVIQQLWLSAAGFDEDDPPEFVREKNFVIPRTGGKYISIPMPLGFNALVNVGRIVTAAGMDGGKHKAKYVENMLGMLSNTFNPFGSSGLSAQTISPTIADPFVALGENRDAFGRPISRPDQATKPVPGYLRSSEGASETSKVIAKVLNQLSGGTDYQKGWASPTADQIDYLAGQAGGGTYREAKKVVEYAKSKAAGEEVAPYKVPLAGRFMGDTGSDANVRNRFYQNITQMSQYENELKGRAKDHKEIQSFLKEHPEARLYDAANSVENEIIQMNKLRKELVARNAPKEQLKRLNDMKIQRMRQLNEMIERATPK